MTLPRLACLISLGFFGVTLAFVGHPSLRVDPSIAPTTAQVRFESVAPIEDSLIAQQARADVDWLAAPERQGRGPGTEGLQQAGQYVADRFAALQLKPMSDGTDGYFQSFESGTVNRVSASTALRVGDVTLTRGTDFHGLAWSKPAAFEAPLAFAGYAVTSENKELPYDDFAGIDVKGKVVLALRWEPHTLEGKSRLSPGGDWSGEASLARKAQRAADAGAVALLLVNPPAHHDDSSGLLPEDERGRATTTIPVFHLTPAAADRLLAAVDAPSLASLQKQIDESFAPASAVYAKNVTGELAVSRDPLRARNVVAIYPGHGPRADECVVVGAHYDHLGLGGSGSLSRSGGLHPGADDNASGTSALLGLAAQVTKAGPRERTVVFVAFTLEEQGLIGSKKFVDQLPIPQEKIVAMLNFDMVGRVRNNMLYTGGSGTHTWFTPILAAADERTPLQLLSMGQGGRGPSDHQSFSGKGIPVLFFFTGIHSDYHRPSDTPDKINTDGIAQVVRFGFDVLNEVCQAPQLAYIDTYDSRGVNVNVESGATSMPANTTRRGGRRVQLGVEPDMVDDGVTRGVRISGTVEGSAARDAGLRAGDRIIRIDDAPIDTLQDLSNFLGTKKPGDVIKVTLIRDGAETKVDVKLKSRGEER
jgi:hypothetical protein